MSDTIQLTDHDALDQLGAIVKLCPHCGKAPRIELPMPGVSPRTLSNVMVNCCGSLFWPRWQAERPADAEIAALRAERDALLTEKERYAAETLTYFGKAAEYAERIAALTRKPDEAEVERVARKMNGSGSNDIEWGEMDDITRDGYLSLARRAIAAFIAGRKP